MKKLCIPSLSVASAMWATSPQSLTLHSSQSAGQLANSLLFSSPQEKNEGNRRKEWFETIALGE
jgi:hypothetical protein